MEALKLNESELRYFGDLFSASDVENTGKVSGVKAAELFKMSQLSSEVLQQITELCGAKRLGHFGRSQFYVALKLIGAAQQGLPLKHETFQAGLEIPLPKFVKLNDVGAEKSWPSRQSSQPQLGVYQSYFGDSNLIHLQDKQENCNQIPGQLPPPPNKNQARNSSCTTNQRATALFSDNEKHSQIHGVGTFGGASSPPITETSPTVVAAPTAVKREISPPSNLTISDKDWAAYVTRKTVSQQESLQWQQFEDEKQLLTTEDENSERHSSDDEYDIWTITDEQREYYVNQFRLLQSDLNGLISGAVAKEFFEKSKLPVQELSKIWQLSDINKDGALSLEEFFTAMHLVVLRRNNIDLPDVLPAALIPQLGKQISDASYNNCGGIQGFGSPQRSPPEPTSPHGKEDPKILHPVAVRLSPESQVIGFDETESAKACIVSDPIPYELLQEQQKSPGKWTSGVNSGSVDGQGEIKLGPPPQAAIQRPVAKKPSVPGPGALPPPPQTIPITEDANGSFPFPPASSFSGSSSSAMSASYHMGMSIPQGPKKEPPPPPPPRPKRNHTRSSSLDLNRLGSRSGPQLTGHPPSILGAPPAVPPRMSPSTTTPKKLYGQRSESDVGSGSISAVENANFANFTQFTSSDGTCIEGTVDVPQLQAGAFEVYKRPGDMNSVGSSIVTSSTSSSKRAETVIMKDDSTPLVDFNSNEDEEKESWPQQSPDVLETPQPSSKPRDKKELQAAIRNHRERNMLLTRLNCELNQELSEVMEERIALEIQLEHMKPYSN